MDKSKLVGAIGHFKSTALKSTCLPGLDKENVIL